MELLFFLLQLLAIFLRCTASQNAAAELVYDTDGAALSSGSSYYIVPVRRRNGGGLMYVSTAGGKGCLKFVAEERNGSLIGTPLQFTPAAGGEGEVIPLSSDVLIQFSGRHLDGASCSGRPLDWHLITDPPTGSPPPRVAAGYEDGGAPVDSPNRVFRVERHAADGLPGYKLVSCAGGGAAPCADLGLFFDKDYTWLTVASDVRWPFLVLFKKRHP